MPENIQYSRLLRGRDAAFCQIVTYPVRSHLGFTPRPVLAVASYCNEADLAALEQRGIDGHVALGFRRFSLRGVEKVRKRCEPPTFRLRS